MCVVWVWDSHSPSAPEHISTAESDSVQMMDAESTCSVLGLVAEHDSIDEFNAISGACGLSELGRLACASHYFQTALKERSNHVWDRMCESTWDGKVHITHSAIALRKSPNGAREALKSSLADAKRTELTDEELCSLDWRFRFKEQAGPQWQEHDPYWVKREATRVRFGARKAGSPRGPVRMQGFDMIEAFQLEWEWRHPYRHLSGRPAERVLQVIVNGNPVPSYVVSRHAANWGWIMQRCLCPVDGNGECLSPRFKS